MDSHLCPSFKSFAKKFDDLHAGQDPAIPILPQYSYRKNAYLGVNAGVKKESDIDRVTTEVAMFVEEILWQLRSNDGQQVIECGGR